jgi:membrane protein implicated in regulation of membrane protease activity
MRGAHRDTKTTPGVQRASTATVALRYLAFQVPGWAAVGVLLAAAAAWWELSRTLAFLILGAWVVKDLVMFPFVRIAYEPRSGGPADALLGRRGLAEEGLAPAGYVRVGGELWRAEAGEAVAPGRVVRVVAVRGLTLLVEPDEEER